MKGLFAQKFPLGILLLGADNEFDQACRQYFFYGLSEKITNGITSKTHHASLRLGL